MLTEEFCKQKRRYEGAELGMPWWIQGLLESDADRANIT